ncbi:caspase-like [Anopheles nili]|uniref:caspase-like n=1 Tax=Anopheles nili TaxID=185578 RepID=UPI00237B419F|nr:caspase-like [Anopheles nili]
MDSSDGCLVDGNRESNSVVQTQMSTQTARLGLSEVYDTSHARRGMAIILSHENFESMKKRDGTRRDREIAVAVLTRLQFDVRVYDDLKCEDLFAELEKLAGEDHSNSDCLLVMVMTHGDENVLYAYDDAYRIDRLWDNFLGNRCRTLLGKPKLFFVQACRGKEFDKGVKLLQMDAANDDNMPQRYIIPTTADLLVMYSTYQGHSSWRNTLEGSWFIQALCAELDINGSCMELLQLLTAVSRRVAYDYQSNVPQHSIMHASKQMPCVVSMLTKLLYFPRK